MISFIWSPGNPLPAGTGGSENYTVGQVRELQRRGIPAQVVTVGLGDADGRDGQSVDRLLKVFAQLPPIPPATIVRQLEELILAPSAEVSRTVSPGSALTEAAA